MRRDHQNGVKEIDDCNVESDGSRLFTFDSSVVIAVGDGSSANDTFERADSIGLLSDAINRFFKYPASLDEIYP